VQKRRNILFLLASLFFMTHCQGHADSPKTTPDDHITEIPTSESVFDALSPIFLIDPIGDAGVVHEPTVILSGRIIADQPLTSLTLATSITSIQDHFATLTPKNTFAIAVENLIEGENHFTLTTADVNNNTAEFSFTIVYTQDLPQAENPDPTTPDWLEQIADLLNAVHTSYQGLANFLEIFSEHEDSLKDIFSFLTNWDGSIESLQSFWNAWANPKNMPFSKNSENDFLQHDKAENGNNAWNIHNLRLSINNLSHLSEILSPYLTDSAQHIEMPHNLMMLQNNKRVLGCNFSWSTTLTGGLAELGLEKDSLQNMRFLANNQVAFTLNASKAEFDTDFVLTANPPQACVFNESTRNGNLYAQNLSGELVLQLAHNSLENRLEVSDIVSSTLKIDTVSATLEEDDRFWQRVKEWVFKHLYGCLFCNTEEADAQLFKSIFEISADDPYKTLFNTALQNDTRIQNILLEQFNSFFTKTLSFANQNGAWSYQMDMTDFVTEPASNQLITSWDLHIDTNEPRDACAKFFKLPSTPTETSEMPNLGDITLELTFAQIGKLLRGMAQNGAFCLEDSLKIGDFVLGRFSLKPYGKISLEASQYQSSNLDLTYPFMIEINWGDTELSSSSSNQTRGQQQPNIAYGSLLFSLHFDTNCTAGVTLSIDRMALTNLTGTLQIHQQTFDISIIEDEIKSFINSFDLSRWQNLPVTNAVLDLQNLDGVFLKIEDNPVVTSSAIHLGLSLTQDRQCAE